MLTSYLEISRDAVKYCTAIANTLYCSDLSAQCGIHTVERAIVSTRARDDVRRVNERALWLLRPAAGAAHSSAALRVFGSSPLCTQRRSSSRELKWLSSVPTTVSPSGGARPGARRPWRAIPLSAAAARGAPSIVMRWVRTWEPSQATGEMSMVDVDEHLRMQECRMAI